MSFPSWLPRPWSVQRSANPLADASPIVYVSEIVRKAARGDAAAFAVLCQSRAQGVVAYVGAVRPDAGERDAVVRRVFIRAWRELPSLDEARRFDLCLLRLAHDEVSPANAPATNPPAEPTSSSYVAPELFALPSTLREALSLHYLFGCAGEDIAAAFDRPLEDVTGWIEAGLEALGHAVSPDASVAPLAA